MNIRTAGSLRTLIDLQYFHRHFISFCALSILGQQLLFKREHCRVEPIQGHVHRKLRFLVEACGLSDGEKGSSFRPSRRRHSREERGGFVQADVVK